MSGDGGTGDAGTEAGCRFVLLGFPRSGTTLLARLLDAHPEVSAPPETNLLTAAARFLSEQSMVEGPPIGVLTGLAFAGIPADEVHATVRGLVFGFHERIAGSKPVWVDKSAVDIFHLDTLEALLAGHARFICMTRHPLDVVASNLDLAAALRAQLTEVWAATRGINNPALGLARAVAERGDALDAFAARRGADAIAVSYEGLLVDPERVLGDLLGAMGLSSDPAAMIAGAFSDAARIGLGDFRIDGTASLGLPVRDGWRKRLPPGDVARIVPVLAPLMERHGYKVPKALPVPSREQAVRQYQFAATLKRASRQE